jgi:hypothetical protein
MSAYLLSIIIIAYTSFEYTYANGSMNTLKDEFKVLEKNAIFEVLLTEDKLILPEHSLSERVNLINIQFKQIMIRHGIIVIVSESINPNNIVCHAVTIDRPTLGKVLKYTCSNLNICARELNSKIEIIRCNSK